MISLKIRFLDNLSMIEVSLLRKQLFWTKNYINIKASLNNKDLIQEIIFNKKHKNLKFQKNKKLTKFKKY
jgi:hypothetical protein